MSTYTVFLIFPSIIGLGIQALVFANGNYSSWTVAVYAAYIAGWALTFTENLAHVEDIMAMRWGTVRFNDASVERGEYIGKQTKSPVDGRPHFIGDKAKQKQAQKNSLVLVLVACIASFGTVAVIYLFRYYLYHMDEKKSDNVDSQYVVTPKSSVSKLALQIASAVNAVQTQLFNYVFTDIAISLTDMENHKLQTSYESSLVAKMFIFLVLHRDVDNLFIPRSHSFFLLFKGY